MKVGQTGILKNDQGKSARVKLEEIDRGSGMFPADYWFSYVDDIPQEDKPIAHHKYGKSPYIKQEVVFPEGMVEKLIEIGYLVLDSENKELEVDYDNPSKGETHGDLEATIADQLRRFTVAMGDTRSPLEDFKSVIALGFNLWKLVGNKVCEDTSQIFSQIVREIDSDMVYQFQEVSNKCNNNDVCSYLYLCLPTLGGDYSTKRIEKLCLETIDKVKNSFPKVQMRTNQNELDVDRIKSLYLKSIK